MARTLQLLMVLDEADGPSTSHPDAATWLAWTVGMLRRTSRRWVRMARQLAELPRLRTALGTGTVSLKQLESLLRIADRCRG